MKAYKLYTYSLLAGAFLFLAFIVSVAISLAQGPIVGPGQPILCTSVAALTPATSASTMISLSAGKIVALCGWHVTNTASSGTFSISYGTGSACGTGNTVIIPTQSITSTAPSADHSPTAFFSTPAGQSVCLTPSATSIAAVIYYNQF